VLKLAWVPACAGMTVFYEPDGVVLLGRLDFYEYAAPQRVGGHAGSFGCLEPDVASSGSPSRSTVTDTAIFPNAMPFA
jgi:hypothetical protein